MRRKIAALKSFIGWLESEDLIKAGIADLEDDRIVLDPEFLA